MKVNKSELVNAIFYIAHTLNPMNGRKGYAAMVKDGVLPEIIRSIAYDMFVHGIEQWRNPGPELVANIELIREYCRELQRNGFVKFDDIDSVDDGQPVVSIAIERLEILTRLHNLTNELEVGITKWGMETTGGVDFCLAESKTLIKKLVP